eukprot:scaffold191916_cov63-Attheya_sp.AAC.1
MSMPVPISLDHGHDDMSDTSSLSAPAFDSGLSSSESTNTPSSSGTGIRPIQPKKADRNKDDRRADSSCVGVFC